MKAVKGFLMIFIVVSLCSCGGREVSGWIISMDVEKTWEISDTMSFSIDINPKYTLFQKDCWLYLSNNMSEYTLHVQFFETQNHEINISLQYPDWVMISDVYLLGIYDGGDETSDFWGLWKIGLDTETENYYELIRYDIQGNVLENVRLSSLGIQEYEFDIKDIVKKDDFYYLLTDKKMITFTTEGKVIKTESVDEKSSFLSLQGELFFVECSNDQIGICQILDGILTDNLCKIPASGELFFLNEEGQFFLTEGNQLFRCDTESKTIELVLKWDNVGLKYLSIRSIIELEENRITVLSYENNSYVVRTIEPARMVNERKVITLVSNQYDTWLQDRVYEFNESNEGFKIVIEDPGVSFYDAEDLQTQIQLLLYSSNPPDIVNLRYIDHWIDYAEKGVFEDLTPYLEYSNVLKKSDYLPNILAYGKIKEKQIFIPYSFTFSMLYGQEKYVGNNQGWTFEELFEISHNQTDVSMFNLDSSDCLRCLLSIGMEEFVDFSGLECDFENQLFYDLLRCAEKSNFVEGSYENFYDDIVNERALMSMADVVNVEFYLGYTGTVQGNDTDSGIKLALKGYPSKDGQLKGYAKMTPNSCFAISHNSKNKDGAWQFIEFLQTYKDDFYAAFPARKDWLLERINKISPVHFANVELREYTKEDLENLLSIMDDLKIQTNQDEIILQIVDEEAVAYFNGWRTEEEVANIIQRRVEIYLSEQ